MFPLSSRFSACLVISFLVGGTVRSQNTALTATTNPITMGEEVTLKSEILGLELVFDVYLPEDYVASDQSYPVIYNFDGPWAFKHVVSIVSYLVDQSSMPRSIVVCVKDPGLMREQFKTDRQTLNELVQTSGSRLNSLNVLRNELFPHIESAYRTRPHRTALGHSANAWFVVFRDLIDPTLANWMVASSVLVTWNDSALAKLAESEVQKGAVEGTRQIFLSAGSLETDLSPFLPGFKALLEAAGSDRSRVYLDTLDGEAHGSAFYPAYMNGLRALNRGYALPDDVQGWDLQRLRDHYAAFSRECGYDIGLPEQGCVTLGSRLLQAGAADKVIEILKAALELYPRSWSAYDLLASSYEAKGDKALAIECYTKSLELNPGNDRARRRLARLRN